MRNRFAVVAMLIVSIVLGCPVIGFSATSSVPCAGDTGASSTPVTTTTIAAGSIASASSVNSETNIGAGSGTPPAPKSSSASAGSDIPEELPAETTNKLDADQSYLIDTVRHRVIRWSSRRLPLRVCISAESATTREVPQRFVDITVKALHDWEQATKQLIQFDMVESPVADISIVWTANPSRAEVSDRQGSTSYRFDEKGYITNASIVALCCNHTNATHTIGDGDARLVILHEIGHALGLRHSQSAEDVMFAGKLTENAGEQISERDSRLLIKLYERDRDQLIEEAINAVEKAGGPDGTALVNLLESAGYLYEAEQKTAKAAAVFARAVSIRDVNNMPDRKGLMRDLLRAARLFAQNNDAEKAAGYRNRAASLPH